MPWLDRDGVPLFYEDTGGSGLPLVLVHGWGCDHSFMSGLSKYFNADHRALSVDLRGHGRSGTPRQPYTLPAFADDLAWICNQRGLDQPVIIGHSMGGATALELAAGGPEWLRGIVLLDTAVLPRPEAWSGVQRVLAALQSPGYRKTGRPFIANTFFMPGDDERRKARIIDRMLETPQQVLASTFEGIIAWDSEQAATNCQVPTLYIGSTHPRADLERFAGCCPQLVRAQVVGSGHFVQLEVPDQVNAMIRRFLQMLPTP